MSAKIIKSDLPPEAMGQVVRQLVDVLAFHELSPDQSIVALKTALQAAISAKLQTPIDFAIAIIKRGSDNAS